MAQGQKSALRKILGKYLPDHLIDRPKRGFIFPQNHLIKQSIMSHNSKDLDISITSLRGNNVKGDNWKRLAVRAEIINNFKLSYI